MKKLLKYFKNYRMDCFIAPAFKLIEACFELCVPLIIRLIVDVGIENGDRKYIAVMSLVLVLLGLFGLMFSVTAQYFSARAAVGFSSAVKESLFAKFVNLPFSSVDKMGSSAMLNRILSDTQQLQTGVNLTLRLFLRSPFVVLGATVMAFTVDVKTASVFVPVILLLMVVVFGIMLIGISLYKKSQGKLDELLHATRENLMGVRVIRANRMEKREKESFDKKSDLFISRQKKSSGFSALLNPITLIIINLGIVVMLYRGGVLVDNGELTKGDVVAVYGYISQILVELVKLASLIITITKALACASRISACLDLPEEKKDGVDLVGNIESIEFDDVWFKYQPEDGYALEGISFKVNAGQTVGIIGGTGSGKSTLVNLIPAFYTPDKGNVKINGIDAGEYSPLSLRKRMGIVLQKAELFSGSLKENLEMKGGKLSAEEMSMVLDNAMAKDFVLQKDPSMDFMVGQMGSGLSGGQKQRLSVARGLAGKPSLVILDDSSSALDYKTDSEMRKRIKAIDNSPILMVVSQRVTSVMNSDLILVLDNGRLVGAGSHASLLNECSVYKEIYNSQTEGGRENG